MDTTLCHSGMIFGSIATLGVIVASVGGLSVLVVSAFRRATRRV